jgi:Major tropism determinant N-terminal domain
MAYQLQLRRDTSVNWSSIDPILAQGEPGYELDTGKIKYGDGVTLWSALPYFTGGGSGGNTTPGGPINSVQFNANGSFSGSSLLTIDVGNSNVVSTGTIVSQYFVGDGSQLSNIPTSNLSSVSNDIIPSANVTYSLGNSTNQWKELWVSGNTIYLGGLPLSKNANGNITYDDQELIAQSNTGNTNISNLTSEDANITNLTSEDANITNIVSDSISSQNIIGAFIAGDGSNIINISYNNIIGAYANVNVAAYLPNNTSNVAAAYFIGDGSQLTNLPVLDNYSNANVAAYLPTYTGDITAQIVTASYFYGDGSNITGLPDAYSNANVAAYLPNNTSNVAAAYFIGDGSFLTGLPDEYSNANVAAYLPTYTGNLVGLTGQVVTTANITGNYILGNAAFMTGIEMAIGSYSNANVNSYLPIYNGNISADIITTNSVNSEIVQFGNANANICTQSWLTAQSSSLSNVILYQVPASDVASIDFNIIATSNNNRQVCKLITVVINTSFEYSEYGSLNIGPLLGNFTIDLVGGNLLLNVEPFTNNAIDYTVVFTTYNS